MTEMIEELGWKDLGDRREARLLMLLKIVNGLVTLTHEEYLTSEFTRTHSRNNAKYLPIKTTTAYQKSFFPQTVPEWNKLSQCTVDTQTTKAFKSLLE